MNLIDLFDKASESPEFIPKLRQLILDLAVRGKLVPQNSKDEPASELLKKIKAEKEGLVLKNIIRHGKTITQVNPDEIPYIVPNNWIWCKLGNLCYKITDGFHNTPPKVSAGRPYISATHIRSTGIAWDRCDYVSKKYHDELRSKTYPHKGEILVVNIGAGCGTSAIIDVDYEFSFKNIAILKFNQDLLLNKFINNFFLFKKKYLYDELTTGGLQPFLSLDILQNIVLPLPPLSEQKRIVAKVDELMSLCDALEKQISITSTQSTRLLDALIQEEF